MDRVPSAQRARLAELNAEFIAPRSVPPRLAETDRCLCDRSEAGRLGDREVWGGADCSIRKCPIGVAHDRIASQEQDVVGEIGFLPKSGGSRTTAANNLKVFLTNGLHVPYDMNVDVEIVEYVADGGTGLGPGSFRYKRDIDFAWSPPINMDTTGGATYVMSDASTAHQLTAPVKGVMRPTGIYVYFDSSAITAANTMMAGDRYFFNITYNGGAHFLEDDDNAAHVVAECSGRGVCTSTGQCNCYAGYGGPACDRTTCPNDCSGHGMCHSLKRLASLAAEGNPNAAKDINDHTTAVDVSYSQAFDADKQFSCFCESGYRGLDCSQQECPSGPDPMGGFGGAAGRDCSGRGKCDGSTGICQCFRGYYGSRCEARSTFV